MSSTRTSYFRPLAALVALVAAMAMLLIAYGASPAHAATTFTVDRTDDPDLSTTPTTDDCTAAPDDCSMHGAISAANATPGDDTIDFSSGLSGTVNLARALPELSSNIAVEGPGADLLTLRRSDTAPTTFRIFTVSIGSVVSISGITISNENIGNGNGGGIFNSGTLTVSHSTISENSANLGGGIFNGGTLTVSDSTISENSAVGTGGGIRSTTSSDLSTTKTTITNSTISGNSATVRGGGLYNNNGLSVIENSTITKNTAPSGGGGVASFGDAQTRTEVLSSIVSANQGTDVDFTSATTNSFLSKGYNLIGSGNATGAFNQTTDLPLGSDPLLGALAENGGPTMTHALQPGSPAIDKGKSSGLSTDQRGEPRPFDFADIPNADGGDGSDIGAYEERPPAISIDDVSVTEGDTATTAADFTVSLSRASTQPVTVNYATTDDTATAGEDFTPSSGTLTFSPGQTSKTATVVVDGDTTYEPDETYFVELTNPAGATISDAQGVGTITNDDPLPDTTAPTTTVALDPDTPNGDNGWYKSPVHATVSASDGTAGSGVDETRCVLDPASVPSSFDDLPITACPYLGDGADVIADGQHTLYAASIDEEANKETPVVSNQFKIDKTAPSVSCSVSPSKLSTSANNHKLVTVTASVSVTDSGGSGTDPISTKRFTLVSVTSNQAQSGLARDDVPNDIQDWTTGPNSPDTIGKLRAERYGGTRIYTLTYQGKDLAGNTKNCSATVSVPKGG